MVCWRTFTRNRKYISNIFNMFNHNPMQTYKSSKPVKTSQTWNRWCQISSGYLTTCKLLSFSFCSLVPKKETIMTAVSITTAVSTNYWFYPIAPISNKHSLTLKILFISRVRNKEGPHFKYPQKKTRTLNFSYQKVPRTLKDLSRYIAFCTTFVVSLHYFCH